MGLMKAHFSTSNFIGAEHMKNDQKPEAPEQPRTLDKDPVVRMFARVWREMNSTDLPRDEQVGVGQVGVE